MRLRIATTLLSRHKRRFSASSADPTETLNPLPATFLRGGTSKGIFLQEKHLPKDRSEWGPIFLGIMGSPDEAYGRQLNGMGGGVSSLSKICVVGPAAPEQKERGIQARYTFVQVGIRDSVIDYSGNCGNLSSMIGVYALEEGLCTPKPVNNLATVRFFNTNTEKVIETTFPVSEGGVPLLDLPEASMAGVPGQASKIILDFLDPSGARTGRLLPTGSPIDSLVPLSGQWTTTSVEASLLDATNPTVFVNCDDLKVRFPELPIDDYIQGSGSQIVGNLLENIRQDGARKMGLDQSAKAQPKIALLSSTPPGVNADIMVHALSMGVLHKAVPMTVGLCLGVASKIQGTIPWSIIQFSNRKINEDGFTKILHPGGVVDVGAHFGDDGTVKSAHVIRTGRRLMKGVVWW